MKYILLLFGLNLFSQENLNFYDSCVINYSPGIDSSQLMTCQQLRSSLASKMKLVNELELADVIVETSLDQNNDNPNINIYKVSIRGKNSVLELEFPYLFDTNSPSSFVAEEITEDLMKNISKYFGIKPTESKYSSQPAIKLDGSSFNGTSNFNALAALGLNYTTPKIRISGGGLQAFRYSNTQKTATAEAAEVSDLIYGLGVAVINSFGKRRNISTLATAGATRVKFSHSETPSLPEVARQNTAILNQATIGVEWLKHPFIGSSPTNYGANIRMNVQEHEYVDPLTFQVRNETYYITRIKVQFELYTKNNTSIQGNVNAFKDIRWENYQGVNFNLNANFNLNRVSFRPSFNYGVVRNPILSPADTQKSFITLTGSRLNTANFNGSLTIGYTFGNVGLENRDRRWK